MLAPLRHASETFAAGDWRRHAAELVLHGLLRGSDAAHEGPTMTDSG